MSKHTPGPWWVTDSGVRDRGGYICHITQPTHFQGQDERYEREVGERRANKNLIAAAPEQNKALIDLLALVQELDCLAAAYDPRASAARAAIAKATGEHHE